MNDVISGLLFSVGVMGAFCFVGMCLTAMPIAIALGLAAIDRLQEHYDKNG